jgi:hypothetical protein
MGEGGGKIKIRRQAKNSVSNFVFISFMRGQTNSVCLKNRGLSIRVNRSIHYKESHEAWNTRIFLKNSCFHGFVGFTFNQGCGSASLQCGSNFSLECDLDPRFHFSTDPDLDPAHIAKRRPLVYRPFRAQLKSPRLHL